MLFWETNGFFHALQRGHLCISLITFSLLMNKRLLEKLQGILGKSKLLFEKSQ